MELTPLVGFGLTLLGIVIAFLLRAVFTLAMKDKKVIGHGEERREGNSQMKRSIYNTERDVQEVKEITKGLARTTTELEKNMVLQTSLLQQVQGTHDTVIHKLMNSRN